MLKKFFWLLVILFWSFFLLIIEIINYEPYIELINIIIGTLICGFSSYDSVTNSEVNNLYRTLIGIINIILGIGFIILNLSLIHSVIILLIGAQLIGISLAKRIKKQKATYLSGSTKRPEPIGPEPEPEPSPF